jgi:hypothetical protein
MGHVGPLRHRAVLAGSRSSVPLPMAVCMCLSCFLIGYVAHRPALPIEFEQQQVRAPGETACGWRVRGLPVSSRATLDTQGVSDSTQ